MRLLSWILSDRFPSFRQNFDTNLIFVTAGHCSHKEPECRGRNCCNIRFRNSNNRSFIFYRYQSSALPSGSKYCAFSLVERDIPLCAEYPPTWLVSPPSTTPSPSWVFFNPCLQIPCYSRPPSLFLHLGLESLWLLLPLYNSSLFKMLLHRFHF